MNKLNQNRDITIKDKINSLDSLLTSVLWNS